MRNHKFSLHFSFHEFCTTIHKKQNKTVVSHCDTCQTTASLAFIINGGSTLYRCWTDYDYDLGVMTCWKESVPIWANCCWQSGDENSTCLMIQIMSLLTQSLLIVFVLIILCMFFMYNWNSDRWHHVCEREKYLWKYNCSKMARKLRCESSCYFTLHFIRFQFRAAAQLELTWLWWSSLSSCSPCRVCPPFTISSKFRVFFSVSFPFLCGVQHKLAKQRAALVA